MLFKGPEVCGKTLEKETQHLKAKIMSKKYTNNTGINPWVRMDEAESKVILIS